MTPPCQHPLQARHKRNMQFTFISLALLAFPIFAQVSDQEKEAWRAQELVTAGKVDEAIRIYRDLLTNSPRNAVLLMNLCIAEYTAKQYREAVLHARASLQVQPDLLPARLFLGASQLELGDFPSAIDSLKLVVAANPRERNGRLMLGEALLETGQPAEALEESQCGSRNASE